jgi:2-polyprenyl-6-hydroxyphenyl methylase/3-demethylubiquinone-9 3-methyltransferase
MWPLDGWFVPLADGLSTYRKPSLEMTRRWSRLRTTIVRDHADIRGFFDACAQSYAETHGNPTHLLQYRLSLIRKHACFQPTDVVLELGCGTGQHLQALIPYVRRGLGIDLSPAMVQVARQRMASSPWQEKLRFTVDKAEQLRSVPDTSVDVVFSVGALEHMLDKASVLTNVLRVLKPGGRFVCLTPNGHHPWYRWLAPLCGLETCHLSTDQFLSRSHLDRLLYKLGFDPPEFSYWTFIPRGDLPPCYAMLLAGLDRLGRWVAADTLRGGLLVCARKGAA